MKTATHHFCGGETIEFTSTPKRGKPAAVITGQLQKRHVSRGIHVWWEVATLDGRNWKVPERMLRVPAKPVAKAKLAAGVDAAYALKQKNLVAKKANRAVVAGKIKARGAFDLLRVGEYAFYRGERRRIFALYPELGKVSLEVSDRGANRVALRQMLGRRAVTRNAVWAHWITPERTA